MWRAAHRPARRSTRSTRACGASCRSTPSTRASTTTPIDCACRKPKPGMLVERRARPRHRSRRQLHGRRSLARYRRRRLPPVAEPSSSIAVITSANPSDFAVNVAGLPEAAAWILEQTRMTAVNDLKVKIFADGADVKGMVEMYAKPFIKGFTTNPTLMRKAGISDYRGVRARGPRGDSRIARSRSRCSRDDFAEMERQAQRDRELGQERQREDPGDEHPGRARVQADQDARERRASSSTSPRCSRSSRSAMSSRTSMPKTPAYVSVFAGRIADTGAIRCR